MKSYILGFVATVTTRFYHYWTKMVSAWCRKQLKLMNGGIQECRSMADVAAADVFADEERVRLWLGRAEAEKKRRAEYSQAHPFVSDNVEQTPLGATGH